MSHDRKGRLPPSAYVYTVPLTPIEPSGGEPAQGTSKEEWERYRARVKTAYETAEWRPAWFVADTSGAQEQLFAIHGLPTNLRERSAEALERVYPPATCRRLLKKGGEDVHIFDALVQSNPFATMPLIRVGLDLAVVAPWHDEIIDRLRDAENFLPARVELEIWANIVRRGVRFEREPPGPEGKRPDFAVTFEGRRYVLEVKAVLESEPDRVADRLRQRLSFLGQEFTAPRKSVEVEGTELLNERLETVDGRKAIVSRQEELAAVVGQVCEELAAAGFPNGTAPAGDEFAVHISGADDAPNGIFGVAVWQGSACERLARRVAAKVEEAARQMPAAATGIVLVDTGEPKWSSSISAALRSLALMNPILTASIKFVVLRAQARAPWSPVEVRTLHEVIPMPRSALSYEDYALAALLV